MKQDEHSGSVKRLRKDYSSERERKTADTLSRAAARKHLWRMEVAGVDWAGILMGAATAVLIGLFSFAVYRIYC